jgi:hypothetical protein
MESAIPHVVGANAIAIIHIHSLRTLIKAKVPIVDILHGLSAACMVASVVPLSLRPGWLRWRYCWRYPLARAYGSPRLIVYTATTANGGALQLEQGYCQVLAHA